MTDTNSLRTGAGYALEVGLYATHKAMTEAADTIDTLRAQLAEAQRDSERLDWIDKQTYAGAGPRGNVWMVGWKGHSMHGLDFRSAIDAAKGEHRSRNEQACRPE